VVLLAMLPALTSAPNGPYHVAGKQILDRQDRPYLIRGTSLAPLTADAADEKSSATAFGPLSTTALVTVRQRLNMNAVRLPVSAGEFNSSGEYRSRVERIVRLANQFELLVILEASAGSGSYEEFWRRLAECFREYPNVFFAPLRGSMVSVIRESGARQPVIVEDSVDDPNIVVQERPPSWSEGLASRTVSAPLLVDGLDPELDRPAEECAAFPADPGAASSLIQARLHDFDAQNISWTLSQFTAGKLITDYRYFDSTKLFAGWTCGKPGAVPAGIGLDLLAHLWGTTTMGLFTVSYSRGGLALARGGIGSSYGPILADAEMNAHGPMLPKVMGNVSIRITDSRGVARLAPLLHTGAGWSYINFLVPAECATGVAEVAVVRADGSVAKSSVLIADVAPGLFSMIPDGRSAADAVVTQGAKSFRAWECGGGGCRTVGIGLAGGLATTLRVLGTGFRFVGLRPDVRVMVGGVRVPVVSMGRSGEPGVDQITVRLPDALAGVGETDLYFTANGEVSNVVRVNCSAQRRQGADAKGAKEAR
jgi:uncharacterized protein (TIGR03437 family)